MLLNIPLPWSKSISAAVKTSIDLDKKNDRGIAAGAGGSESALTLLISACLCSNKTSKLKCERRSEQVSSAAVDAPMSSSLAIFLLPGIYEL